ncbi:MAG TPA: phosphate ABC transporter substrate-binding protein PstS [Solirubrobacteraceae bacterium]|nr:phosphate ABC transporter substrate-binding protein PstS [Solirubrobacteraceae bacterium]
MVSLTCAGLLAGCVFGLSAAAASAATPTLNGAGSTLVAPIEAEWAAVWDTANKTLVNYSPVGSGTGEKDIAAGLVDFGASDAPLSVYPTAPANLIQIPWALSATGVSYHLNGLKPKGSTLKLTGSVLAQIYLGQITNWGSKAIKNLNKGVKIPNKRITVFFRSDGSGDTYAFTRYLSDVSGAFNSKVGSSTTVSFPVGLGEAGNEGMATALKATNGGIAYIAVSYLIANNLPAVAIKNGAGNYVVPNLSAIAAAASGIGIPANRQLTIVDPGRGKKKAYPISTFTYAFVPTNAPQGALIRSFIGYAITQGQDFGPSLDFSPLPQAVVNADEAALNSIN